MSKLPDQACDLSRSESFDFEKELDYIASTAIDAGQQLKREIDNATAGGLSDEALQIHELEVFFDDLAEGIDEAKRLCGEFRKALAKKAKENAA